MIFSYLVFCISSQIPLIHQGLGKSPTWTHWFRHLRHQGRWWSICSCLTPVVAGSFPWPGGLPKTESRPSGIGNSWRRCRMGEMPRTWRGTRARFNARISFGSLFLGFYLNFRRCTWISSTEMGIKIEILEWVCPVSWGNHTWYDGRSTGKHVVLKCLEPLDVRLQENWGQNQNGVPILTHKGIKGPVLC